MMRTKKTNKKTSKRTTKNKGYLVKLIPKHKNNSFKIIYVQPTGAGKWDKKKATKIAKSELNKYLRFFKGDYSKKPILKVRDAYTYKIMKRG